MRSKPLKTLLNSVWKKIGPNRSFQLSQLPTVDNPITISRHGEDYRAKNSLCARCGNHSDNDSSPCDFHPLYENIKNDDRLILGCELTSLLNSTSIVALSSHSVKRPRSSPVSNILEEHLPRLNVTPWRGQATWPRTVILLPRKSWPRTNPYAL